MINFVGLHGGKIEEQDDQTAIFVLGRGIGLCGGSGRGRSRLGERLDLSDILRGNGIDVFNVEGDNLLRFVVFEDGEVLGFQSRTNFPSLSRTVTFTSTSSDPV